MMLPKAGSALTLLGVLFLCPAATVADDDGLGQVTTIAVSGVGKPIVAKTDKDGAIHLFCDSDGGPTYAKSSDGGVTFGPPIPVVGKTTRAEGVEYSAWDMAVANGGRVHVALGTNAWKLKLPNEC